jgi:hypothetical protein
MPLMVSLEHTCTYEASLAELPGRGIGQLGVLVVGVARGHARRAVALRFLVRLDAPAAGDDEVGGLAARQVQRHDGVFAKAATLHEQDVEMGGDGQQRADVGFGLGADGTEFLAAMAHLHHAHAAALPVEHFGGGALQHRLRHGSRTGREVVGALAGRRLLLGHVAFTSWLVPWRAPWRNLGPGFGGGAQCLGDVLVERAHLGFDGGARFGHQLFRQCGLHLRVQVLVLLAQGRVDPGQQLLEFVFAEVLLEQRGQGAGCQLHGLVANDRVGVVEVLLELGVGSLGSRFALGFRHLRLQVLRTRLCDRSARLLDQAACQRFDAGTLDVDELLDERGLVLGHCGHRTASQGDRQKCEFDFFH